LVPLRAVNAESERPIFSLDSWLARGSSSRAGVAGHEAKSKERLLAFGNKRTKDESPLTHPKAD
jgi:hypothetical protein